MKTPILLVDDEERFLTAVVPLFEKQYEVRTASDGQTALALLQSGKYNPLVVLADQRMPKMTGLQLFEELGQLKLAHLGRILFTGYGDAEMAINAFNRGLINNYLQKPINAEKLILLYSYIDRAAQIAQDWQQARSDREWLREAARRAGRDAGDGRLVEGVRYYFHAAIREILCGDERVRTLLQEMSQLFGRDPQMGAPLNELVSNADRVLQANRGILHQLLHLLQSTSQFSASGLPYEGGYHLHDIIFTALTSASAAINTKGIQVRTQLLASEGHFPCVPSDMFHVFHNILLRAAKVTPEVGQILIQSEENREQLVFSFSDSGPRLDEEMLSSLFEPAAKDEYDLHLCRRILEKYSGRIIARVGPLGGASIQVQLPLNQASA